MAYKKYIKRGGKVYGPYIYHSKKVKGKVISEYLGKDEEKNNKKRKQILIFLITILVIFSLIIGLNYNKIDFNNAINITKSTINNIITPITKSLTGFAISESPKEDIKTYPEIIDGRIGQAYQFDGINDYIDAGNDSSLNFGTGDFTIEAWFKLSSYPTNGSYGYPIVQKTDASYNNGWWLWVLNMTSYSPPYNYNTRLRFAIFEQGIVQSDGAGTTALELDTWYHAVGVKGTNYTELYLNGVKEYNNTYSSINSDSTENLLIGIWIDSGSYFNGTIENIRIFNRSLSANEIAALYEQKLTIEEKEIFDLKEVK